MLVNFEALAYHALAPLPALIKSRCSSRQRHADSL